MKVTKSFAGVGLWALSLCVAVVVTAWVTQRQVVDGAARPRMKSTTLLTQPLSDIDGKEVTLIKLDYEPGAASPEHHHPGHVVVYVLSGELTSQLDDGEAVVYGPGEVFYEAPNGLHAQSKNDGTEENAVALAFFVADEGKPRTQLGSHSH